MKYDMKHFMIKKLCAAVLALLLAALPFTGMTALAETAGASASAASGADLEYAVTFTFSGAGVTASGQGGYSIDGTAVKIEESGTYIFTGSCNDGSITVKKDTKAVYLVLSGLELTSQNTAPVSCNKGSEVVIIAAEGTVNTLSDTELNNDETHTDNENAENAVIKCKDGSSVTLAGAGTLNIIANGKNGIKGGADLTEEGSGTVKASLTVTELTLNITASVNDGLKADSLLELLSGNITVSAADDAIKSDLILNIGAEGTEGPAIVISSCTEGIEAAEVNIFSGDIRISASDDGINAANSDLSGYSFKVDISGGSVYVDAEQGDGIDSNGTLTISGGTVTVFASSRGDNSALDSQTGMAITGGTVLAIGSSGMAEGPSSSGQTCVIFGQSGIGGFGGFNPGGQGGFNPGGQGGFNPGGQGGFNPGGQGGFNPGGQGGFNPGGQGGFNPGGQGGFNPGSGMTPPDGESGATPPDDGTLPEGDGVTHLSSSQGTAAGASISISAGDTLTVVDETGAELISATAKRAASWVLFSSSALTDGSSYKLLINGSEAASAEATSEATGTGGMPGMPGGVNGMPEIGTGVRPGSESGTGNEGEDETAQPSKGLSAPLLIAIGAGGALVLAAAAALIAHAVKKHKKQAEAAEADGSDA